MIRPVLRAVNPVFWPLLALLAAIVTVLVIVR